MAVERLSSTLTLTNLTSSRDSDISSRIGEIRRQGTHQGAQKSTITGLSERRTSLSKVASVTSATAILSNLHWSLERFSRHILARVMRHQATGKTGNACPGGEAGCLRRPDACSLLPSR